MKTDPRRVLILAVIWMFIVSLAGCTGLSRNPQGFEEYAWVAAKRGVDLTRTANGLRRSNVIDSTLHNSLLDQFQKARDGGVNAVNAARAGDFEDAQSRIDRVEGGLQALEYIINAYGE